MGLSYILKRKLENKRKQRVLKRNKENNESIIGLQQVTISGSTDINEDTHVVEEIKGEIEEKMEKALDEEVNKTKEVYLGFRSEDFWKNKAHLQESEENKEEKTDMLKLAAESQELYKTNKENESNLVDLKKEKVTAPVGAKPWKTMKKAI